MFQNVNKNVQESFTRIKCIKGISKSCILHVSTDPGIVRRDLETLRSYNQIVRLDADRLPRIVLEQDLKKGGDWSSNLWDICSCIGERQNIDERSVINIKKG